MHLHRVTPDPFNDFYGNEKFLGTISEDYVARELGFDEPGPIVVVKFPRFGNGEKRQSDFEVLVKWEDIDKIIEKFCDAGRSEALAIQSAMKLATAAKELGWRPPENASPYSD
jgi:hypothetical protein